MSEYTPPSEDVRNHYAYGCGPEHTWHESREDFDRWLRNVQAEAWERGYLDMNADRIYGTGTENPYREDLHSP